MRSATFTGAEVRAMRHRFQLTQEDFAHAIGVTVATVNRWENGRNTPTRLAAAKMTEFCARQGGAAAPVRGLDG